MLPVPFVMAGRKLLVPNGQEKGADNGEADLASVRVARENSLGGRTGEIRKSGRMHPVRYSVETDPPQGH